MSTSRTVTSMACAAILLGAASPASAHGWHADPVANQRCVPDMRGQGFGSGEATTVTEYATIVAHCMDDYFRLYRKLPG